MKQLALEGFPHLEWIIISMFLFLFVFLGVLWWTTGTEKKKLFSQLERLPLDKGPSHE